MLREKFMRISQHHMFDMEFVSLKKPNFLLSYLQQYSERRSQIWSRGSLRFQIKWVLILASKALQKKCYRENSMMTCLKP